MFDFIKRLFSKKEEIKVTPDKGEPFTTCDIKEPLDERSINIEKISFIEIEKIFSINSNDSLFKKSEIVDREYKKWGTRRTNSSYDIREKAKEKANLLIKLKAYYKTL